MKFVSLQKSNFKILGSPWRTNAIERFSYFKTLFSFSSSASEICSLFFSLDSFLRNCSIVENTEIDNLKRSHHLYTCWDVMWFESKATNWSIYRKNYWNFAMNFINLLTIEDSQTYRATFLSGDHFFIESKLPQEPQLLSLKKNLMKSGLKNTEHTF